MVEQQQPIPENIADPRWAVKEKWAGAVTDTSGFVAIPTALFRYQADLGLSNQDLTVLCNLLVHWWSAETTVFPRTTTIARRMGTTPRTVQRSLKKLVDSGLIDREFQGSGRRVFRLDALGPQIVRRMKGGGAKKVIDA